MKRYTLHQRFAEIFWHSKLMSDGRVRGVSDKYLQACIIDSDV